MQKRYVLILIAIGMAFSGVQAAELSGTLKKLAESGVVTIGYRQSSKPFSYVDKAGNPVGYSLELCTHIVDVLKKTLNKPELKTKWVPVSSQTRIPYIANGTIDLECGSTSNLKERQKQVAFSNTIFVTNVRILTKANAGIQSLDDLDGKVVVTTTGTTSSRYMKQTEQGRKLDIKNLYGKDHNDSFAMVESGRAVAFVMDDVLLAALIAEASNPKDYAIIGRVLSVEPYGIVLRKDDPAFKKLVDGVLADLMKSGEFNKIYQKWFMRPIPPNGVILNLPMSDKLKALIKNPNDDGV